MHVDPSKTLYFTQPGSSSCLRTKEYISKNGYDMQVMMSMMETTVMMCRACSAECMMHAEMSEHCRMCAMACDQAVMAMEKMMGSMKGMMPAG